MEAGYENITEFVHHVRLHPLQLLFTDLPSARVMPPESSASAFRFAWRCFSSRANVWNASSICVFSFADASMTNKISGMNSWSFFASLNSTWNENKQHKYVKCGCLWLDVRCTYLSNGLQITFVSNQYQKHIGCCVSAHFFNPSLNAEEGRPLCDVINCKTKNNQSLIITYTLHMAYDKKKTLTNYNSIGWSVVALCDCAESFLSSSIPNLYLQINSSWH